MNKNRQIVLQNPFHPLDLSPHDLLAIYKRFQQSRVINRNPKQQLPIQTISQLISALKGCPPSYVQKCISQALIKSTISWNQFLTFLDQQSQVREKILDWLMFEQTATRFKLQKQWAIRGKINKFYDQITYLKFIDDNSQERLAICCVDQTDFYLIQQTNRINIIDSYTNKTDNSGNVIVIPQQQSVIAQGPSKIFLKNDSKFKRGSSNRTGNKSKMDRSERQRAATLVSSKFANATMVNIPATYSFDQEDQQFYTTERSNISSMFNVFKGLSIQNGVKFAKCAVQKIRQKKVTGPQVTQLKEIFGALQQVQKLTDKQITLGKKTGFKTFQDVQKVKKSLLQQKRGLSYNPYKISKFQRMSDFALVKPTAARQRKQASYTNRANQVCYNGTLRCLAVMYFNMQLCLVRVVHQYNKLSLEEQGKIRINLEKDNKKNEIIQGIDFYYHSIVDKWFLVVLIRIQYKNQYRNSNESYVKGYQLTLIENKRRNANDYAFKSRKQVFSFFIGDRIGIPGSQQSTRHEIFKMNMQMQYGIHFISVSGRYFCYRQNYIQGKQEDCYFTFEHQQKFKNSGMHLSCLVVVKQMNKIVFGTIRGFIIIYDIFSHMFKVKKVANCSITQIHIEGSLAYLLTADEKFIFCDLAKVQEVQNLSIRNENKLHQKTKLFEMSNGKIYFYGNQIRCYAPFYDQKVIHQQRKMQTIYKWRLDKLFKEDSNYRKGPAKNTKILANFMPRTAMPKSKKTSSVQMVLSSQSYFLVLTDILELIVVDKQTLKIKFTMILSVPHDSKVIRMTLSPNQKLLAILLLNQHIQIFNIHTQEPYQHIKPQAYLKYSFIVFLDKKNQYLLANGTQNGKIVLTPYNSIPQKTPKILSHHTRAINCLAIVKKQFLVSCGQDMLISVWQLPFNVLKHEIRLKQYFGDIVEPIGSFKDYAYFRTTQAVIVEINTHQGRLSSVIKDKGSWQSCTIDSVTGKLMGVHQATNLQIIQKQKQSWALKSRVKLQGFKGQIRAIGVVETQKSVLFLDNGVVLLWNYDSQKLGKSISLLQN